jgi:hypothetical protein
VQGVRSTFHWHEAIGERMKPFDQAALDAASREVHMMLLREGSSWGTKACEEMGRVFMVAYHKALPSPDEALHEAASKLPRYHVCASLEPGDGDYDSSAILDIYQDSEGHWVRWEGVSSLFDTEESK